MLNKLLTVFIAVTLCSMLVIAVANMYPDSTYTSGLRGTLRTVLGYNEVTSKTDDLYCHPVTSESPIAEEICCGGNSTGWDECF
jgi:hypothetical protein